MAKKYVSVSPLVAMGYGCKNTILEQVRTGEFIAKNPGGGKWIVDLESYEEWLERRTTRRKRRTYRRMKRRAI